MLIAPGTSLGGSRPKASFANGEGSLWIAKFPAREDRYDVGAWEFVVHQLAKNAGIWVPDSRVERFTEPYRTFCVSRFDGLGESRRMFASAMTLLEHHDGDRGASYIDLAEFISDQGAASHIDGDIAQLFRRVVFNVMVGNRDDHLRNHGFVREPSGWRLAPAYDMNPNPYKSEHSLTLDGATARPSLDTVVEAAEYYRLDRASANRVIDEVRAVVVTWQDEADKLELSRQECALMKTVFLV
jgi:serine/threonine-protein kinase HipA